MKKTKTILTLALCGTLAFGGSTLVSSQNTQATEGLLSSLNRLENSINRTYDFSNLEQTFLNDDYFLFYNSGTYGISNTRSNYLYDGYSNFNQSTQNQQNMKYNSSQNENNEEYYVLHNTTPNQVENNQANNNQNTTPSKTINNQTNNAFNTAPSQTYNSSNSQTNNNSSSPTNYQTNNLSQTNRQSTNSNQTMSQNTQGKKYETTNSNQNNQRDNTSVQEITTGSMNYNSFSPSIQSLNQNLSQNIQTLKQNLNQTQQNTRSIRFYASTINSLANKLEQNEKEMFDGLSKKMFTSSNEEYNDIQDAINLNLKATLKSRIVILECANEAIINLNNMFQQTQTASTQNGTTQNNTTTANTTQNNANIDQKNNTQISTSQNTNKANSTTQNNIRELKTAPQTTTNAYFGEPMAKPQITKESFEKCKQ